MLHDQFGVLNDILMAIGILLEPVAWTADPELAMGAVIMVDVWEKHSLHGLAVFGRPCRCCPMIVMRRQRWMAFIRSGFSSK